MNSNLIPEQRVDKNGVTVTRHVRPSQGASSTKSLPKPKLDDQSFTGLKTQPTKAQSREHFYMFNTTPHPVEEELLTALGIVPFSRKGVHASEYQVYDVLSVTDRGTALALLESGIHTSAEAKKKLKKLGMEHLLQENADVATDALNRNIISYLYVNHGTPSEIINPRFLDWVESINITQLKDYPDIHLCVKEGLVRVSDIREVTPERIKMSDSWGTIKPALVKIADGSANYTAKDVGAIMDKYINGVAVGPTLRNAFALAQRYGTPFALEVSPTNDTLIFSQFLEDKGITDVERGQSLVRYKAQVTATSALAGRGKPSLSHEDIIKFHDAGVNPDHAASGRITITQLEGMSEHGIAPSVSGGWL